MRIIRLIETLNKHRIREDKLEEQLKKEKQVISDIEDTLTQEMINKRVPSISVAGIGTVFLSKQEFPSIEDVPTFYSYLREHNYGDLIKETVHPQTLRGWWNNLEEKPAIQDIGLNMYTKSKISIRKN